MHSPLATLARLARTRHALMVVALATAAGCANDLDVEGDGEEPIDDRLNESEAGIYDCTERSDTGYRSGNSFPIKVVKVDAKPIETETANAYIAMQAKAKTAGINIRIVSGFRTNAEQQYFYNCYVNCNCNSCNLAARPGTSNHQSGHALDLNTSDGGVYSWLSAHADEFGFRRTVPSEIWHWEFWGARDFDGPCGGPPIPRECQTGNYDGEFCDDDGSSTEESHDRLKNQLGVNFHCGDIGGNDAFCGTREVTRVQSMYVLGKSRDMPINGHRNAFRDDNGHANEKYMDAGKAFGVLLGSDGRGNPDGKATRSTLAVMLSRIYLLPPADRDYFDDDQNHANEGFHNRVAAAGLIGGFVDNNGGRKDFRPNDKATRNTLATLAVRAFDKKLVPIWDIPKPCLDDDFDGAFCDDDDSAAEPAHDRLVNELHLPGMFCTELAGSPTFCAGKEASRAMSILILGGSAGMPLDGHPNGFTDDNDHPREAYFDAAKAYGIIGGYNNGREARPSVIANRDTIATLLVRMYSLPASPTDFFSDDDGDANEALHNKVGAAGLFTGYSDGRGGRKFKGAEPATKSMLATVALRAKNNALVPVWAATPAP
ncbi:MAG: M15 family metallopeptidase [Deltaproteobacteria bacterium]|nr:M15 family metallopeptidase [Deltaproteobacteria bacterium]